MMTNRVLWLPSCAEIPQATVFVSTFDHILANKQEFILFGTILVLIIKA